LPQGGDKRKREDARSFTICIRIIPTIKEGRKIKEEKATLHGCVRNDLEVKRRLEKKWENIKAIVA